MYDGLKLYVLNLGVKGEGGARPLNRRILLLNFLFFSFYIQVIDIK